MLGLAFGVQHIAARATSDISGAGDARGGGELPGRQDSYYRDTPEVDSESDAAIPLGAGDTRHSRTRTAPDLHQRRSRTGRPSADQSGMRRHDSELRDAAQEQAATSPPATAHPQFTHMRPLPAAVVQKMRGT